MEGGPLLQEEFAALGKDNVLFCHITTRIDGHPNDDLLTKMGGRGFPTVYVLDADGHRLAEAEWSSFPPPPADFAAALAKGRANSDRLAELKGAADGGDATAAQQLFALQIDLGHLGLEEARTRFAALTDVGEAMADELKQKLVNLEFDDLLQNSSPQSRDEAVALGKKLAAMEKLPTGEERGQSLWNLIMLYAEAENDVAAFQRGIDGMRKLFGEHPNFKRWVEAMETKLEKLKEAAAEKQAGDGKDGG